MSNALDDLLDNEHAQLHGKALTHPSGRTSRVAREEAARAELRRLRAIEAAMDTLLLEIMLGSEPVDDADYHGIRYVEAVLNQDVIEAAKRAMERSGT